MERSLNATEGRQQLTDLLQAVREQEAFFDWLEATAARNAERNAGLSDEEVLAIIEQARKEVASAGG